MMDEPASAPNPIEEISIFCPVRLYLGSRRFDGLLDTLDSKGGTFYMLTEEAPAHPGSQERMALLKQRTVDLVLSGGQKEMRISCRVRGMHFDEDGLYIYVGLRFLLEKDEDKRKLDDFIASLW
jgi:hypothetical protein